ncbi:MAG: penicillin-binding protein [Clostridia bacterium]|nr:penicillin-binding protein [Clostridia bacterium]
MKKVKNRTVSLLILVILLCAGMTVYLVKYIRNGADWASFSANNGYYTNGILSVGRILDRDGLVLSEYGSEKGRRLFPDKKITRISTLHLLGDQYGYIGTGAVKNFASELIGYNLINGSYSLRSGGNDLYLTVDADLNDLAYQALDGKKGCVGVCNYKTGEILVMVTAPSYDPVVPPDDLTTNEKYEGVYINRFLSSTYSPGSTFKLVTTIAAIEKLPNLSDMTFHCEGSAKIGEGTVTCTKAHGTMDIAGALAYSCNCAYAELALQLGGNTLAEYFRELGLTDSLSIDDIATARGSYTLPDSDNNLGWSGVGQYKNMINPASMLRLMGAIAGDGRGTELRLIRTVKSSVGIPTGTYKAESTKLLSADTAEWLTDMMRNNVEEVYGADRFPGLDICAKSGTAEVGGGKEPHALFAGFIRNEEAPLAFIVIVENGGRGSTVAGNVASTVLQAAVKSLAN